MDEKMFELLEKVYIELQEVKNNAATKHDLVRIENKMDTNHKALYDGYVQSNEGITEINYKLDELTERVDTQDAKLRALK